MARPAAVDYPTAYKAIVVGGGHAGCEAALALARCGFSTLLLTQNVDRIGWMSCNPAIGGIGKSHLVAEIDALGGEMARITDLAGVQYKELNSSRGPAVRALRAQCDKLAYATAMRRVLEQTPNLAIKQGNVERLVLRDGQLHGVEVSHGLRFFADIVVLTAGTFLSAVLHTGLSTEVGGRAGDQAAMGLGDQLRALDVKMLRHKTGTCPRVDGRTVDWSQLEPDPGMVPPPPMHRHGQMPIQKQMPAHIAYTTPEMHEIIRQNLDRSPMFSGIIEGTGPRYCPSIEDKVVRFAHHDRHYIFLEREGWDTDEIYVNGLSTSLPADVQVQMVRAMKGLENAEIIRFGYAVEYDAIDSRELGRDLMLRALPGLYLAGQVNGTSGYEEAAGQGLVAALNAVQRLRNLPPVEFSRTQSYLGVMIDDLTTLGAEEPYRMFTSRAEHRLTLRTGNADLRLTALGRELGLVKEQQWQQFEARTARLQRARQVLQDTIVKPTPQNIALLEPFQSGALINPTTLAQLLCRPNIDWPALAPWLPLDLAELDRDDQEELITAVRYQGYVQRETVRQARTQRQEQQAIPLDFPYAEVSGLSAEALQKLMKVRPTTLAQAARIPGVTSAALQVLAYFLRVRAEKSVPRTDRNSA